MSDLAIVNLRPQDLSRLEALLLDNQLPADDCRAQASIFCALYAGDELIAAGGLEAAGEYALLRSIVVREGYRGRGFAQALSEHLLRCAEDEGRAAVYLLTETAAEYFSRLGFTSVERAAVPPAIARTRQFSSLCPDSAHCMCLTLPRA